MLSLPAAPFLYRICSAASGRGLRPAMTNARMRSSSSVIVWTSSGLVSRADRSAATRGRSAEQPELGGAGHRIGPDDLAADVARGGSSFESQSSSAGSHSRTRRRAGGAGSPGSKCRATRCVRPMPAGGVCTTSGSGGKWPRGVGVERRADPVEVALHGLVHALGEREVRDRVVDVEQSRSLLVDRCRLSAAFAAGRRQRRTDRSRRRSCESARAACGRRARCAPRSPRSARWGPSGS